MPAKGHSKTKFRGAMCSEIIEMFAHGDTRSMFCARHRISEDTFSTWLDKYPLFNDAYMAAHEAALAYYDTIAKNHMIEEHQGAKLNTRLYELMMRNRFQMPQNRIVKLQGMAKRSAQDKIDAICSAVEAGQLTADEAQKLAGLIDSTIKAQQYDDLENRIKQIEQVQRIGVDDEGFKEVENDNV